MPPLADYNSVRAIPEHLDSELHVAERSVPLLVHSRLASFSSVVQGIAHDSVLETLRMFLVPLFSNVASKLKHVLLARIRMSQPVGPGSVCDLVRSKSR